MKARDAMSMMLTGAVLLASGGLFTPGAARAGARHSADECRAACEARNIPASCNWLSRVPQRCIRDALRACRASDVPGPAQCLPPKDLPACGTNHECPYGALCLDATCQVLGCGDCSGTNQCQGDKCVVGECSAVTANCPKGFHCEPASPPFDTISGTCAADQPGVTYCAWDTDCIAPGNFNPTCVQGICTDRTRRLGSCQTNADCQRWCRRGRFAARMGGCDAAGMCVCPDCADDAECGQLLACPQGRTARCLPSGTCACRKPPPATPTTTTTVTTTTDTTDTDPPSTTTTTLDTTCCCTFEVSDTNWHCVHESRPSPWLCYVPWPDCCDQPYTVCQ